MNNSRISLASICILFFMLWAPLGQYDFLIENWMKLGAYAVPLTLFLFFSFTKKRTDSILADIKLMSVLLLVAYLIHQFEEHWIDLFGNHYAFYNYFNAVLLGVLGSPDSSVMPVSSAALFVINTSLVWLVGIMAIWRSPNHLFPVLAMNGIVLVNAISHILSGIVNLSYNPGLLTAISIFIPLAIAFYRKVLQISPITKPQLIASLVWAILAHVILIAGLIVANWFRLIPESVYFAMLVAWSVVPVFLFVTPVQQNTKT
ncbi:MAG: HXXEE domain-containing protein [Cyanobacteria bacterium P01_F01_bin.86]